MIVTDTRTLTKETRAELRKRAVQAYLSSPGRNMGKIAEIYHIRRQTLRKWVRSYKNDGNASFSLDSRGAKKWEKTKLTLRQSNHIKHLIITKTPDQLQFPFMLWTRKAVQELIANRYEVKLGLTSISKYLKKWGMTPQKPKLKSYRRQPAQIQKWIDEIYPSIHNRAVKEGVTIHFGDETGIRSQDQIGKGFSPKGVTPILETSGTRFGVNMVSTITNNGSMRFMLFEGSMNAEKFIVFLRQLTKSQKRKIFLILDNSRVHHAKIVKSWVDKHQDRIELFFLPAYAPDYNPDELLNNTLKIKLNNTTKAQNKLELIKIASKILRSLQNTPRIIRSFFEAETTSYAGMRV